MAEINATKREKVMAYTTEFIKTGVPDGKLDEILNVLMGTISKLLQKQDGFRDSYLLVDRDKNLVAHFVVWESEDARDAWNNGDQLQEARAALAPFMTTEEPEASSFELVAHITR